MKINTTTVKLAWLKLPEGFDHNHLIRRSIARAYKRGCRFSYFVHRVGSGFAATEEAANEAAARKARRACPGNPPSWNVYELKLTA